MKQNQNLKFRLYSIFQPPPPLSSISTGYPATFTGAANPGR